jgi:hypothetical protein
MGKSHKLLVISTASILKFSSAKPGLSLILITDNLPGLTITFSTAYNGNQMSKLGVVLLLMKGRDRRPDFGS